MIIVLDPTQYNKNFIMFSEKTKNNILSNGNFYRIFYSPPTFCLNGIHMSFSLDDIQLESYFNKIKCTFDKSKNIPIINIIKTIERNILAIAPKEQKTPIYRIEEQLSQGFIKIFSDEEYKKSNFKQIHILLKISGVWTDSNSCGITFRFFFNHR